MEENGQKPNVKNVPYSTVVDLENSLRQKTDSWRFRLLGTVLRQAPGQIDRFLKRYSDPLN